MSFRQILDRVIGPGALADLEHVGDVYTEATTVIVEQQEVCKQAFKSARDAAKAILVQLCSSEDVPMHERAAWSAAFHGKGWDREPTLADLVQRAESYGARLSEIDAQLREPAAPIFGFITGSVGDYKYDRGAMRYAYRVSDGSGLAYTQHYNDGPGWYYHEVLAGERPLSGKVNVLDGRRDSPLISYIGAAELADAVAAPEAAAEMLSRWYSQEPKKIFVIGAQAVSAMFEAAGSTPRSDLLLGHAVHLGFRPEF